MSQIVAASSVRAREREGEARPGRGPPPAARRAPGTAILDLQATAGNAAVAGVLARQPAAQGPRYTVAIGDRRLEGADPEAAAAALASHLRRLDQALERSWETLDYLWETYREQWFVGGMIDLAGGPERPTAEIWAYPLTALGAARASVTLAASKAEWARRFRESGRTDLAEQTASLERESGEALADAGREVDEAAQALRDAQDRVEAFVEGTVSAGDRVVTGLRVAVVAGSVAGMALGGVGAVRLGAGFVASAAASGAAGGAYGVGSDLAEQASEIHHDQRQALDVGRALRRGAADAVTGFVGGLAGGLLTKALERAVGGYLGSTVSDDVLAGIGREMGLGGPLPRTYLQTGGQRLAAEVVAEMGATPLTATVDALVSRILEGGRLPQSLDEFGDMIAAETAKAGALQLALGAVTRRRVHAPAGEAPAGGAGDGGAGRVDTARRVVLFRGTTHTLAHGDTGVVHDLGPGLYLTPDPRLGVLYAQERRAQVQAAEPGAPGIVLRAETDEASLGRVLDVWEDRARRADWEAYLARTPGGDLVLGGGPAEMYNAHFQNWLATRRQGLDDFDTIIAPEYIRGGPQVCVRNQALADRLVAEGEEWARAHDPVTPAYPDVPEAR